MLLNILIVLVAIALNVTAQGTTTTVSVQETSGDLAALQKNHYWLQVAKSVATSDGTETFKVVFSSSSLGPNMNVAWTETFGLNWVSKVPAPGANVTFGGDWQACAIGESFDLNDVGIWEKNLNDTHASNSSVNVGNNGFTSAVNIIVGIQGSDNAWNPIFVDPDQLLVNGNGQYEPKEDVKIWYQESDLTATMIAFQGTVQEEYAMAAGDQHWFYYNVTSGAWSDNSGPIINGSSRASSRLSKGKRGSSFLGYLQSLF